MNIIDKQLVKQRFSRHIGSYATEAAVQKVMADELLCHVEQLVGKQFSRIFEIGCGCGFLTRQIADVFQFDELYLNDLVEACAALAEETPHAVFLPGDVEQIEFPDRLDLVISNATMQWMERLPDLAEKIQRSLSPGGVWAFTTFGPENCLEIRELCNLTLPYPSLAGLKRMLAGRFELLCAEESVSTQFFSTPIEVLEHLKATGVSGVRPAEIWTRGRLKKFSDAYRFQFSDPAGRLSLTYHPIRILCKKTNN